MHGQKYKSKTVYFINARIDSHERSTQWNVLRISLHFLQVNAAFEFRLLEYVHCINNKLNVKISDPNRPQIKLLTLFWLVGSYKKIKISI